MKKLVSIISVLALILSFTACTGKPEPVTGDPEKVTGVQYVEKTGDEAKEESKVGEDEVRVYIPADYLYSSVQSISDDAKSKGGYDVTVYEDGSVAYLMSRSDYDKMMADNKAAFEENIADLKQRHNRVFTDIKYNEDFSHIDFYVNATVYTESGDTMVQENLYAGSRMYQMYLGKDPKTIKMTFNTYDSETGEKVESSTYPDDLNH